LDYLQNYPYGCTEQRIALARAELAAKDFADALQQDDQDRASRDVNQTLAWISNVTTPDGLVSFWPGDQGYVVLTAWAVEFMVEAQKAGFNVDPVEMASLTHALQQALRSDDPNLVSAYAYVERAWALSALAYAGALDRDYADELARQQDQLSLEGLAQVALALQMGGAGDAPIMKPLQDALWNGIVIKLRDGNQVYGGLQQGYLATVDDPEIFPSETRTLAEMLRATDAFGDPRRKIVMQALVGLGQDDGWGSTNANAEALLALTDYLKANSGAPDQSVTLSLPKGSETIALTGKMPLAKRVYTDGGAITVTAANASVQNPLAVQDELSWLPQEDGSKVAPVTSGFVVTREDDEILPNGAPPVRTMLDHAGIELAYHVGDIIEDHVQVVNPEDRHYVAITVPLAAGMEPLDPTLATAPPEATPSAPPTLSPSYVAYLDDRVSFYYDTLPKGTYDFYFRTKAITPGHFIQPAAQAVMMYDDAVSGGGAGAMVAISLVPAPAPPPAAAPAKQ
jgi:alpha-2-macroglobulin